MSQHNLRKLEQNRSFHILSQTVLLPHYLGELREATQGHGQQGKKWFCWTQIVSAETMSITNPNHISQGHKRSEKVASYYNYLPMELFFSILSETHCELERSAWAT